AFGIFRTPLVVTFQHDGLRLVWRSDWRFCGFGFIGAALPNENSVDAGYRLPRRRDWIRRWPHWLFDFRRRRLRHSDVASLGNEFSQWLGADNGESSPHTNIRIFGRAVDWLYLVAHWGARRRWIAARRRSLRFLLDSYGSGALSRGVYSHQSAFVFRSNQCAGREHRFDSGGSNPAIGIGSKDSPADGNLSPLSGCENLDFRSEQ